jgi:CubicO group peptidase (beta-lactamase class C family)
MNFSDLQKIIECGTEAGQHTAAQVYISLNGEVILDEVYPSDGSLSNTDSMLWMSAGKPLTAAAITALLDSTELKLEDPVAKWVPAFGCHGKESITLLQLLTHTGGFRGADMKLDPMPFEEALSRVCQTALEPKWVPGEKAGYHMNSSWILLAAVIEAVSDQDFISHMSQRILHPAGMERTRFQLQGGEPAIVYDTSKGDLLPHPKYAHPDFQFHLRPGGNVCGPASDLGRFYETLLLHPERIHLSELRRNHKISRVREGMMDATFRAPMDWGLGVILNSWKHGGKTIPYGYGRFASDTCFGHGGAQCSIGFADPVFGLAVAVVFDGMPGEAKHQQRMRECCEAIYEELNLQAETNQSQG